MPFFLVIAYITISYTHLLLQFVSALVYHSQRRIKWKLPDAQVLILIPSYRESLKSSIATINSVKLSLENSGLPGHVIYIEDDTKVNILLKETFSDDPVVHVLCNGYNQGKRESQVNGWNWAVENLYHGDVPSYVLTVDSDTQLDREALSALLSEMRSPEIAAVTGNITIGNKQTFLQRLISLRYFLAFNQERAAQSLYGQVLCCSGPLTLYKGQFFEGVKDEYISQVYGGRKCTFGDDRHLTNLAIKYGYKTLYSPNAIAYTDCPSNLRDYSKQQYRWTKSFFRESFLTLTYGRRLRLYTVWEIFVALTLPTLLLANIVSLILRVTDSPIVLLQYGAIIIAMAWLRSIFGLMLDGFNDRRDYFFFPVFAILNIVMLMPIRLHALLTLNHTAWGTR